MKPYDLVVLCALATATSQPERNIPNISRTTGMSTALVHESLKRLIRVQLVRPRTYEPLVNHVVEFVEHGIRFVFPAEIGRMTRGVPTASSAPPLDAVFLHAEAENEFVWPYSNGQLRGSSIKPLHTKVPISAITDPELHALLALLDGARVDDPRVRNEAVKLFRERMSGAT